MYTFWRVEQTKCVSHLDFSQGVRGPSPGALGVFGLSLHVGMADTGNHNAICLAQQSASTLSAGLGTLGYWPHRSYNFGVPWLEHDSMEHHQSSPIHRSLAGGAFRIVG